MTKYADSRAVRRYAGGDVVAIAVFVVLGEISHGANPIDILWPMTKTLSTFLFGWFFVAVPFGAYGAKTLEDRRWGIALPIAAWALADVIAQVLRSTAVFPGDAALTFYVVALVFGGGLLLGWRAIAFHLGTET